MNRTTTYPPQSPRYYNGGHRYFFNGQEADNEVFGESGLAGYEFREYDTRLGRWWGVDPYAWKSPGCSPYMFCSGSPIVAKDFNGGYGVVVIKQQCDEHGNVVGGTATLVMTFYYNSDEHYEGDGKMSAEQAQWVQRNIQSNFMEAATLDNDGDTGEGSQYSIRIDFAKLSQYVQIGWADGQTPIHELFHTIGAADTKKRGGTRLMDYNDPDSGVPVLMRWIMMDDLENLFYENNERLQIIYEDE